MFVTLKFDGASIGAVYSSLGIAAVFMPALLGIVADKWLSAKWVYAICHTIGAITLFMAAEVTTPEAMFLVILINSFALYANTWVNQHHLLLSPAKCRDGYRY